MSERACIRVRRDKKKPACDDRCRHVITRLLLLRLTLTFEAWTLVVVVVLFFPGTDNFPGFGFSFTFRAVRRIGVRCMATVVNSSIFKGFVSFVVFFPCRIGHFPQIQMNIRCVRVCVLACACMCAVGDFPRVLRKFRWGKYASVRFRSCDISSLNTVLARTACVHTHTHTRPHTHAHTQWTLYSSSLSRTVLEASLSIYHTWPVAQSTLLLGTLSDALTPNHATMTHCHSSWSFSQTCIHRMYHEGVWFYYFANILFIVHKLRVPYRLYIYIYIYKMLYDGLASMIDDILLYNPR